MTTIKSLDQIRKTGARIYVRWSRSLTRDQKRGYSLRCGTQAERGLSACEIDPTWEDWRILRQLGEYRFCGGNCWIITGDEVGKGADNEPLLRNVKLIAKVSTDLLNADGLLAWRNAAIADDEARLTRITDEIARNIVQRQLDRLRSDDRKTWERILYGY